jgi:hypothetical protein
MLLSCGAVAFQFSGEREMRRRVYTCPWDTYYSFRKKSKEHPAKFIAVSALKFWRLFRLVKRVIEDERAKEVREAKTVLPRECADA